MKCRCGRIQARANAFDGIACKHCHRALCVWHYALAFFLDPVTQKLTTAPACFPNCNAALDHHTEHPAP